MWRDVLQSGEEWDTLPSACKTGVTGLLPLRHLGHLPSHLLPRARPMDRDYGETVGVPRALRILARREEQAHGATEVPHGLRGRGGSGQVARALHLDLDARRVRALVGFLPVAT